MWWPFQVAAAFVSYAGFALSAWVVGKVHGTNGGALVLVHVASVQAALLAAVIIIDVLNAGRPVAVPHPLFYVVSVTLPFHWRSGFLLVPLVMLLAGFFAAANAAANRESTSIRS